MRKLKAQRGQVTCRCHTPGTEHRNRLSNLHPPKALLCAPKVSLSLCWLNRTLLIHTAAQPPSHHWEAALRWGQHPTWSLDHWAAVEPQAHSCVVFSFPTSVGTILEVRAGAGSWGRPGSGHGLPYRPFPLPKSLDFSEWGSRGSPRTPAVDGGNGGGTKGTELD